jgi:hypothetical protein
MMSYNINTTIDFGIERIKDLTTDEYRVVKNDDDLSRVEELMLKVEGRSFYSKGRTNCLPEDSYPEERDVEILSIKWNGKDFPWDLTVGETDRAIEMIAEEGYDEPEDDRCDYDFED